MPVAAAAAAGAGRVLNKDFGLCFISSQVQFRIVLGLVRDIAFKLSLRWPPQPPQPLPPPPPSQDREGWGE